MTGSSTVHETLRKVLLATDLSARCDRALERAVSIVASSKAHLTVLHVVEELEGSELTNARSAASSSRAAPDAILIARSRIREGLQADVGDAVEQAAILIEEGGEPAEVVERVATSQGHDLIVTGIAREGLFASRPVILGRTVERLLRRMPVPILIVRNRPRAPYRHILVTTDFSEPSAHALQVAMSFFPHRPLHLLHAFAMPHSDEPSDVPREIDCLRQTREMELDAFLSSMVLPEDARRSLVTSVACARPAQLVHEYVRDRGADLVVLGTRGRSAMVEAFLGSTAKSILQSLPCDALVVSARPKARLP